LLGALLAQPLSAQELEAFTATKELEAFAPTTIVRVNVNAVAGDAPASLDVWVGSCALPCGFEGAFEAGLDRRDKVKSLCWLLALCPFASKRNKP
jgi:hypothetical protein